MIREILQRHIEGVLEELSLEGVAVVLEHPAESAHGDYSTNVALAAAKKAERSPREFAEGIAVKLTENTIECVAKIEVAGPGFINFYLSPEFFTRALEDILEKGDAYGSNELFSGKKVMIEYTDPNPFKVFHIGHLMTNVIGESIARLFEFSGAEVKRANYQGDVGLHVAKTLWAVGKEGFDPTKIDELSKAYTFGSSAYEEDEVAKKEIIEINKKIYAQDPSVMEAYTTGREVSLAHFEELYKILGTTFDFYFFEGETWEDGQREVEGGLEKGIFEESDGAVVFRGEEHDPNLHTRVLISSEGLPTYEAKDIGLIQAKQKAYPADLFVYSTAVEQQEYFKVVFKAIEILWPEFAGKLKHVAHGMLQLSSGKMSSRKGNVITGESLLVDSIALAKEKAKTDDDIPKDERDEIAQTVGVAALKYVILRQSVGKNIIYDQEKSLSFEGDSGPYLQYAYVRTRSVLKKAGDRPQIKIETSFQSGLKPVFNPKVIEVERLLYQFPEVVERAVREYEPHHVTTYLIELAGAFNSYYATHKIIGSGEAESYRLALTRAVGIVLKNGLNLLGMKAPERM